MQSAMMKYWARHQSNIFDPAVFLANVIQYFCVYAGIKQHALFDRLLEKQQDWKNKKGQGVGLIKMLLYQYHEEKSNTNQKDNQHLQLEQKDNKILDHQKNDDSKNVVELNAEQSICLGSCAFDFTFRDCHFCDGGESFPLYYFTDWEIR